MAKNKLKRKLKNKKNTEKELLIMIMLESKYKSWNRQLKIKIWKKWIL